VWIFLQGVRWSGGGGVKVRWSKTPFSSAIGYFDFETLRDKAKNYHIAVH